MTSLKSIDNDFWQNPPWGNGREKFRLGLRPVNQSKWFASKISNELLAYKKNLLKTRYQDVIAITDDSVGAQELLAKKLNILNEIIEAKPTDGLWDDNRNDEDQLGMTYDEIEDAMLRTESKSFKDYQKIRSQNIHKMEPIPICMIDEKIKTN